MESKTPLFLSLTPLISVFDMQRSLTFYQRLGFEIVSTSPAVHTPEGEFSHWMWLRLDSIDLMLNTQYDSGERPDCSLSSRTVSHEDTSLFIGCADVDAAYARLTARGLVADPPVMTPYGLRRFSAKDPDGYEVILQQVR